MPKRQRIAFAAVAALIAVVAVVVLSSPAGDSTEGGTIAATTVEATPSAAAPSATEAAETSEPTAESTPEPQRIVFANGEVEGGNAEIELEKGETARFTVRSDVADEIHVHGYDVVKQIAAGGIARFSFEADISGVFEIELEGAHVPIGSLKVSG